MPYITYAPIDRQFGCLERDLPPGAPFNGIDPVDGITFGFALQSRYPLGPGEPDIRFGTVSKKPADNPAILLRAVTKAEYDAAYAAEMAARVPEPPSDTDINAERDRRLGLGITFAGHPYQTDEISRQRINTSRISAMAAIMGGAQPGDLRWPGVDKDFFWIAADDVRVPMDAQTMVAFGNAVAAREGLLIVAGNDLKQRIAAGEAISNIGDDKLWPA
ncbi:DUF4376 domain-containing protein [Aureimonas ureilytica]|uniref:DUF4376 domain-containing protein n=1 Tax=Aureimonas ureilytica TaxID=401562 RepID=UPI003CF5F03D